MLETEDSNDIGKVAGAVRGYGAAVPLKHVCFGPTDRGRTLKKVRLLTNLFGGACREAAFGRKAPLSDLQPT
jgi:hypothetical protein